MSTKPRLDVYASDGFTDRVAFAAVVIARGGERTRKFDETGEMYDGPAVTAALMRRAKANPDGKLARNLFQYIGEAVDLADPSYRKHACGVPGPSTYCWGWAEAAL